MDNLEQGYNGIYDMLDEVSRRPGMYIGTNNLNDLVTFIFGYQHCSRQHKHRYRFLYPLPFELFTPYCAMKFHEGGSMGFGGIILEVCHQDQEQALLKFFEVLNEFRKDAHVTMCRMCELSEENINYHLNGRGVRRIIGSHSDGTRQEVPAYQSVKQFYHIAFSYGADLLIPVSNDKTVSGQIFYASTGGRGLEVFEHLGTHMESCFGSVSWKELELTDEGILLLLNDYYFNNGKTEGIYQEQNGKSAKEIKMVCVEVIVTKIIDTNQPFWVECKMKDVYGNEHVFQDKMPVFLKEHTTEADLPANGQLRCMMLECKDGVIRIDTSKPDDVESKSGKTIFEVSIHQLK